MTLMTKSGDEIFKVGIGTWGFGGTWESVYGEEQPCIDAIKYAVSKGQNHIDSGEIYGAGHTDDIIGQAIAGIDREKLFLSDKLWETSVATGKVRPAVTNMLKKLGTDYLDLLYIHKPWEDFPWIEAIPQMNGLVDEGIIRYIGVSNFNVAQMEAAQAVSAHPIAVNQLHFNIVYRTDVSPEMLSYCKEHNVQIVAYRPLERAAVLENEIVNKIAAAKSISPAQLALAWLLHSGTMPIPQATDKEFIDDNIGAVGVDLTC